MTAHRIGRRSVPLAALVALIGLATWPVHAGDNAAPPLGLPAEGVLSQVPMGVLPGGAESNLADRIKNPDANRRLDVEAGRMLYVKLNCADCHGYTAKGGSGPSLITKSWRFGGTPADIYKSIYEGRPMGMPAWGQVLPSKDIWQLVAYIESLGGSYPPSQYQTSLQGDRPCEQVAPELDFEQQLNGSPPYRPPPCNKSSGRR
jgi:cytochrome c oxidase cbb3-type subunit 3